MSPNTPLCPVCYIFGQNNAGDTSKPARSIDCGNTVQITGHLCRECLEAGVDQDDIYFITNQEGEK